MLGKFQFRKDFTYRMPVHFQNGPFNSENRVVYSDCFLLNVEQKTEFEALAQFVPSEFEILRPVVCWGYANCRGVDFLAHGEYRIFQASVPVRFIAEDIIGVYPLVIWENNAIPILGGREEDGMPKVWCDIAAERHYENHYFAAIALECETMARFDFFEECEVASEKVEHANASPLVNNFGYRYIPRVAGAGTAHREPILYPQMNFPKQIWHGTGKVEIMVPDRWYKNASMFSTLKGLAGLPNLGFENATRMSSQLKLCVADSRSLPSAESAGDGDD